MESPKSLPRFLTVAEVADWLGLSRARVYELVAAGDIPHLRLSARRILFDPARVVEFIERRGAASVR